MTSAFVYAHLSRGVHLGYFAGGKSNEIVSKMRTGCPGIKYARIANLVD